MIRLGIAGAGRAATRHALAATEVPGARIVRVLTGPGDAPALPGSIHLADALGIPEAGFHDLAGLDALVVATRGRYRTELVGRALAAGVAVLVHRPLGASPVEADRLASMAEGSGVVCAYGENLMFAPAVVQGSRSLGSLGPLRHLSARCTGHGYGAVAAVIAWAGVDPGEAEVSQRDAGTRMTIPFGGGLVAEVTTTGPAAERSWEIQAASADHVLRAEVGSVCSLELDGEPVALPPPPPGMVDRHLWDRGYLAQLGGFVDAVGGRGGRVSPFGFGRLVQHLIGPTKGD